MDEVCLGGLKKEFQTLQKMRGLERRLRIQEGGVLVGLRAYLPRCTLDMVRGMLSFVRCVGVLLRPHLTKKGSIVLMLAKEKIIKRGLEGALSLGEIRFLSIRKRIVLSLN